MILLMQRRGTGRAESDDVADSPVRVGNAVFRTKSVGPDRPCERPMWGISTRSCDRD